MILLKATTETLQMITTTVADIDYSISYVDITTTSFSPSTSEGKVVTATTTTVLAAPAASTQRQVKLISITNRHASTSNSIRIVKNISATQYYLTPAVTLLAGETMQYMDGQSWVSYTATGSQKIDGTLAQGSDTSVQYNTNGTMDASSTFTYNNSTSTLGLSGADATIDLAITSALDPPAAPADTLTVFSRKVGGRVMLGQMGPSGLDTLVQPFLARNKIAYWNPPGNSTTVPGVFGIAGLTAIGTATTRSVATTNLATRMRRLGYPSSTTAGTFGGARLTTAQFSAGSGVNDGSGFYMVERWVESDGATVSGRRSFHGMTSSTSAPTNVEPSTLTNSIGVAQLSTDATQWYWIGAGSSAQSAIAVGTAAGAPAGNSTTAWELAIFAPNGIANTYYLQLTNLTTRVSATRTFSGAATVVPQSTTLLTWIAWVTNNATALAVGMDLCSLYIETDN